MKDKKKKDKKERKKEARKRERDVEINAKKKKMYSRLIQIKVKY